MIFVYGIKEILAKAIPTHCPQGHEFTSENTYRCKPYTLKVVKESLSCKTCRRNARKRHETKIGTDALRAKWRAKWRRLKIAKIGGAE